MTLSNSVLSMVALSALFSAPAARAEVWKTTRAWSFEVEKDYQDWLLKTLDKEIFTRPGPLQGVKLDCADSVYSMRMLFSYESGLPFVIRDGTGKGLVSNEMSRFDSIQDQDKRFRAFATWVYDITDTHTLPGDSYSPAINRGEVHGGAFMRTDPKSHHSWTVQQVDDTGIPHLFFASRPARTTLSQRNYIPTMGFMFPKGVTPASQAGFRRWRHPEDALKPEWEVPGYSLEEYQIPIGSWIKTVQAKLQLVSESAEQRMARALDTACQEGTERVSAVQDGVAFLAKMGKRACMTSEEFDDYSTPNKDARVKAAFDEVRAAFADAEHGSLLTSETRARAESVLAGEASTGQPGAFCPVTILTGRALTLGQIFARSESGKLSSNPHDSIDVRWGEKPGPSARAKHCPTY